MTSRRSNPAIYTHEAPETEIDAPPPGLFCCEGDFLKSSQKVVKTNFPEKENRMEQPENDRFMRFFMELVDGFEPPTC